MLSISHNSSFRILAGKFRRKMRRFLQYDIRGIKIFSAQEGNDKIRTMLNANNLVFCGRLGATELMVLNEWHKFKKFSDNVRIRIKRDSGVFSNDQKSLQRFVNIYENSLSTCNLFGVWFNPGEYNVIRRNSKKFELTELRALESYYSERPWTEMLRGKKVLVVHPFSESIQKQYERRQKLFVSNHGEVLPEFTLKVFKAVQALDASVLPFSSWFDALEYMKDGISKIDFDIALIGAGAFGMPLGAFIRQSLEKSVFVTAGATQLYFGIRGNRWENHEMSRFFNDHWVRPMASEVPQTADKVEGACYW
jgi:hypothetical protein